MSTDTQLDAETAAAVAAHEYLTFTLGDEEYGVDILKVQEIRGYDQVTRLPGAPDFVKGAVNLRGLIVPVVDMRLKFGLSQARYDETTVMVILAVAGRTIGVVVDAVSDVIRLDAAQLRGVPDLGSAIDRKFLTGLGVVDERMLILLDIERLMTSEEMGLVDRALAA
ncbi:chemotaxis protein CheW [Lysobacter sp. N42]|jgi:purine-binding chemotaxis protein CheW|uniref:chemotaxis protein CheW n=1 Tax=Lysobacter sp. N42 TaxID=2545719 RepID=UPI001053B89A|nr:chemotaxis protein CheW [Lysobacter sp. N42]TCZ87932.1 chemotaxis protein CheW [Lysobacter sp. N42]